MQNHCQLWEPFEGYYATQVTLPSNPSPSSNRACPWRATQEDCHKGKLRAPTPGRFLNRAPFETQYQKSHHDASDFKAQDSQLECELIGAKTRLRKLYRRNRPGCSHRAKSLEPAPNQDKAVRAADEGHHIGCDFLRPSPWVPKALAELKHFARGDQTFSTQICSSVWGQMSRRSQANHPLGGLFGQSNGVNQRPQYERRRRKWKQWQRSLLTTSYLP